MASGSSAICERRANFFEQAQRFLPRLGALALRTRDELPSGVSGVEPLEEHVQSRARPAWAKARQRVARASLPSPAESGERAGPRAGGAFPRARWDRDLRESTPRALRAICSSAARRTAWKTGLGDRWDSNPQQPESQSGTLPLSYGHRSATTLTQIKPMLACPAGLEPTTPSLEGWCSIRATGSSRCPA